MSRVAATTCAHRSSIVLKSRAVPGLPLSSRRQQSGLALLAMLTLLTLWGLYLFVGQLSARQFQMEREQHAAAAMAEARDALIGDAIARLPISAAGYLHLPDMGIDGFGALSEGQATASFLGNDKDLSVIGKFPWNTKSSLLATGPLRDAHGECLWYVVSGSFKITPKAALNWDTQGQIDLIDGNGKVIAGNLAALIVAPGRPLDAQDRTRADKKYVECGGNYDAQNYLDAFDKANAIAGQVNYFAGSTNNRVALDSNPKSFVVADSDHYNDRFLYITADEILDPLFRGPAFKDPFKNAIGTMLDYFKAQNLLSRLHSVGSKGTDKLSCSSAPDKDFCNSWKEMLLLTELSPPSRITVDGLESSVDCGRVLIFGGRKTVAQNRGSADDKSKPVNYLEGLSLSSFNVPNASATSFSGSTGDFNPASPGTDLVRCLP